MFFLNQDWHVFAAEPRLISHIQQVEDHRRIKSLNCKYLVAGDTKHTPFEIKMAPGILSLDPEQFSLMVCCINPPLPAERPGHRAGHSNTLRPFDDLDLFVYFIKVLGEDKPLIWCDLKSRGHSIQLQGMMDTGADAMVIPPH